MVSKENFQKGKEKSTNLPDFAGIPPKLNGVRVIGKLVIFDYDFSGREVRVELPDFVRERKQVSGLPSFAKKDI